MLKQVTPSITQLSEFYSLFVDANYNLYSIQNKINELKKLETLYKSDIKPKPIGIIGTGEVKLSDKEKEELQKQILNKESKITSSLENIEISKGWLIDYSLSDKNNAIFYNPTIKNVVWSIRGTDFTNIHDIYEDIYIFLGYPDIIANNYYKKAVDVVNKYKIHKASNDKYKIIWASHSRGGSMQQALILNNWENENLNILDGIKNYFGNDYSISDFSLYVDEVYSYNFGVFVTQFFTSPAKVLMINQQKKDRLYKINNLLFISGDPISNIGLVNLNYYIGNIYIFKPKSFNTHSIENFINDDLLKIISPNYIEMSQKTKPQKLFEVPAVTYPLQNNQMTGLLNQNLQTSSKNDKTLMNILNPSPTAQLKPLPSIYNNPVVLSSNNPFDSGNIEIETPKNYNIQMDNIKQQALKTVNAIQQNNSSPYIIGTPMNDIPNQRLIRPPTYKKVTKVNPITGVKTEEFESKTEVNDNLDINFKKLGKGQKIKKEKIVLPPTTPQTKGGLSKKPLAKEKAQNKKTFKASDIDVYKIAQSKDVKKPTK